ncbi:MAG: hypothetical protein BJ554DRAFT_720 [Olpidium bornovanus]|uniref:Uncharacterized protein n=1 Tax=Olpidium bornovanus TaxID=278681 RepID=A0A8H8DHN9_9FUNG|nr:MAG: hypothetical protein BJ554DRAFT_720 [Olpidium bornovanus]
MVPDRDVLDQWLEEVEQPREHPWKFENAGSHLRTFTQEAGSLTNAEASNMGGGNIQGFSCIAAVVYCGESGQAQDSRTQSNEEQAKKVLWEYVEFWSGKDAIYALRRRAEGEAVRRRRVYRRGASGLSPRGYHAGFRALKSRLVPPPPPPPFRPPPPSVAFSLTYGDGSVGTRAVPQHTPRTFRPWKVLSRGMLSSSPWAAGRLMPEVLHVSRQPRGKGPLGSGLHSLVGGRPGPEDFVLFDRPARARRWAVLVTTAWCRRRRESRCPGLSSFTTCSGRQSRLPVRES